jgi:hypothetical protein
MQSIAKSVKVLSQVIDLLLGADFTTPTEKTMTEYLKARYSL